ncbi:MAG: S41 family peptidase [Candidatus Falkowbacteria bacterium]
MENNLNKTEEENVAASYPIISGKKKNKRRSFLGILLILLVLVSFGGGFYLGQGKSAKDRPVALGDTSTTVKSEDAFDFNVYLEAWDSLRSDFVYKNKIKDKDMFYGSIKGLAASMNDPYTVFMTPSETKEFSNDLAGTFEGIGAEIGMRNNIVTVIAPLSGMPAEKAGLKAGDKVYAIDGKSALGLTVDEAVKKIRGTKGTTVSLTIIRDKETNPREIKIVRGTIVVKSVNVTYRPDGLVLIKVSNFNDDTLSLFQAAVKEIVAKKPKGIILDLRNNPGGYLDTAVAMASEWVKAGPVVLEQFGDGKRNEYPALGNPRLDSFKTIVLVNGGSASASEIVSGALRDYKKATLVGEQTFGKGSVQTVRDLSDGSSIKITIATWMTPNGDFINEKGLAPQVEVKLTAADVEKNKDPQLQKAVDLLLKPAVAPAKVPVKKIK